MGDLGQNFREAQRSSETMAQFVILLEVVAFLVAIAAAVWIFRDAKSRGKSGFAAALIAFLSAFYGIHLTVIVLCTWILFRPENTHRGAMDSENRLPEQFPSSIVAAPATQDFLKGLEESN